MPTDEHGEYWDYISRPEMERLFGKRDPAAGLRGDAGLPLGKVYVSQGQPAHERIEWLNPGPPPTWEPPLPGLREYIVITRTSTVLLEQWINHLLAEGWTPLGGVAVSKGSFYQAMGR